MLRVILAGENWAEPQEARAHAILILSIVTIDRIDWIQVKVKIQVIRADCRIIGTHRLEPAAIGRPVCSTCWRRIDNRMTTMRWWRTRGDDSGHWRLMTGIESKISPRKSHSGATVMVVGDLTDMITSEKRRTGRRRVATERD